MPLELLETFVLIAELDGDATTAAERLGISQVFPSVSPLGNLTERIDEVPVSDSADFDGFGSRCESFRQGDWEEAKVKTTGEGQGARLIIIRPSSTESEFTHGEFYVRGRFEIVEKINNSAKAAKRFKEQAP